MFVKFETKFMLLKKICIYHKFWVSIDNKFDGL